MNGVPTCADPDLLKGIIRGQWGLDGFVFNTQQLICLDLYSIHNKSLFAGHEELYINITQFKIVISLNF